MTDAAPPSSGPRPPDHFIQQLDLGIEPAGERHLVLTADCEHRVDVGLLATIVDVIGGWLILRERPQSVVPTTNLELFGLDQLHEPGTIVADARLAALSKRRACVEVVLDVAGHTAWSTVGFAVRDHPEQPPADMNGSRPRVGRAVSAPLWNLIGAQQVDLGADVDIEPRLYNNAAALQGGATMALLEAAALTALRPGESIGEASINYFAQVTGDQARARVRWRNERLVVVDVHSDGRAAPCATAAFGFVGDDPSSRASLPG